MNEVKIAFTKYEAQVLIDALDCYQSSGGFCDDITANTLYNRVVDEFKDHGIDIESDEDDDE